MFAALSAHNSWLSVFVEALIDSRFRAIFGLLLENGHRVMQLRT